tara:strand:- start:1626 stop:2393 length:768 start_codon:yes stop_codon:yes gene_type:complete
MPKIKVTSPEGLIQIAGGATTFISSSDGANKALLNIATNTSTQELRGLDVSRGSIFRVSPTPGVREPSGSLLQLKGRAEGLHFHVGGNQYITNNSWFDASKGGYGAWIYETNSAAFRWGFRSSQGAFDLDYAIFGTKDKIVTGSLDGKEKPNQWGVGLSMTASNGAIAIGKEAGPRRGHHGTNATLDITGSNSIALAVTGAVEFGCGAPDGYMVIPNVAVRPSSPKNGMMIYNTAEGRLEAYQNGAWVFFTVSAV